jgi:hypothetical protein
VWQKSNETDFLLTMNFILFTNQGYPLQNSSLGQLHSYKKLQDSDTVNPEQKKCIFCYILFEVQFNITNEYQSDIAVNISLEVGNQLQLNAFWY